MNGGGYHSLNVSKRETRKVLIKTHERYRGYCQLAIEWENVYNLLLDMNAISEPSGMRFINRQLTVHCPE
jgi:hypothetical protein